jgi:hypothetical protein
MVLILRFSKKEKSSLIMSKKLSKAEEKKKERQINNLTLECFVTSEIDCSGCSISENCDGDEYEAA